MRTITFEDQGQDFLEWDVDDDGNVVDCRPFQVSIWTKCKILNLEELHAGEFVLFKGNGIVGHLRYPIVSIKPTEKRNS